MEAAIKLSWIIAPITLIHRATFSLTGNCDIADNTCQWNFIFIFLFFIKPLSVFDLITWRKLESLECFFFSAGMLILLFAKNGLTILWFYNLLSAAL